jgi:anti-sigma factor RsiW
MAPDDEELLQLALDGEALTEEAGRHLEQCETCQRRLAEYKDINASLVSHLYRSLCPPGSKLSLYCAGLLSQDEQISIETHLLDCPLCAEEVALTQSFLAETLLPCPDSLSNGNNNLL